MFNERFHHFATIVLLMIISFSKFTLAAPHYDAPASPQPEQEIEAGGIGSAISPETFDNLAVTEKEWSPPAIRKMVQEFNKSNYYYSYKQEFDIRLNAFFDLRFAPDKKEFIVPAIGFDYNSMKNRDFKYKAGADFTYKGDGSAHFLIVKVFNETGSFRPFYQYGLMYHAAPEDQLAGASNWENYLLRAGVGFSDIVAPPRSVKINLDFAIGASAIYLLFSYGPSWGF
ncbi:MAG: hypothetical protein ABL927_02095 [Bdellovibrionales bacterium]